MKYTEFVEVYDELYGTRKKLEKRDILARFLRKLKDEGKSEWIYLLKGRVVPDYDPREIGISRQLAIKALSRALGINDKEIYERYRKVGDLGEITEELVGMRRQKGLFRGELTVKKVFENLRRLMDIEGKGTVDKKLGLISELLSHANGKEAKYIIRTTLGDLRIGVADGILRDAIAEAFFHGEEGMAKEVQRAYDLSNDFADVFDAASKGRKDLESVAISLGKPINVMLAVKVENIEEAFNMCGKPAAFEYKYDGFRVVVSKRGDEVRLFTRRLEDVTRQFPDVVKAIKQNVKGKSFILDGEVVGYDPKTKRYMPFQAISQRIRRKYHIERLMEELPVEINIFDVIYHDGESVMAEPFDKRRKIVEKIVRTREKVIRPAVQIVTDDAERAEEFYQRALDEGEEGVIVKNLKAPYTQGRRVGFMAKLKPEVKDMDLVIVGAEYGSGKRGGWLTSYYVACRDGGKFLDVGKVSSGLKEKSEINGKEQEGTTYEEMTKLLRSLVKEEKGRYVSVKPEIVVSVTYQDIQKSPAYSSGYALRFPRITAYRPDRKKEDITTLEEIEKEAKK